MGDIVINADTFFERLSTLYNSWKADKRAGDGSFVGADSIVILTGKADQDTQYTKSNALHVKFIPVATAATSAVASTDQSCSSGFWAMNFLRP